MNAGGRLALFGAGLAVVFAAAAAGGKVVDPDLGPAPAAHGAGGTVGPAEQGDAHAADPHDESDDPSQDPGPDGLGLPGGLQSAAEGYRLVLEHDTVGATPQASVPFTVLGPDGSPVTAYEPSHDEDLHLIAVRRDLTGYQHVHPDRDADGTWQGRLDLTAPGSWRVFADFDPQGPVGPLTLGTDLSVPGAYAPREVPAPAATAQVDGYTVTLDGELVAGSSSRLTLSVSKDGTPVTDLEPYLAAYGHLVALRQGDLAYLHVHPDGATGDGRTPAGPDVVFHAEVPSEGTYRLYLDFQHRGVVRTAEFTALAGEEPSSGH